MGYRGVVSVIHVGVSLPYQDILAGCLGGIFQVQTN